MNHIEQRIAKLEGIVKLQTQYITDLQEVLTAQDTHNREIFEASKAAHHVIDMTTKNSAFNSLFIYWLVHVMEKIEHIFPEGSADLILNSVEESMDPKVSKFYNLFETLREKDQ